MKKLILTALIAVTAYSAFAFDSSAFTPAGKVTSYTKTDYSVTAKFGEFYRSPKSKYVHVFDATGLETETSEYNAKDVIIDKISYQYDASRNLVSSVFTDATNAVVWKTMMVYEAGKLKEESEFDKDNKLSGKTIYKYSGSTTDESYYDANGKLLSKTITKSNDANKLAEEAQYFEDGSLDVKKVYTYNDKGLLSQIETFDSTETSTGKSVYKYDDKGFISEVQVYYEDTLTERNIYKNDANGNPTKITTYMVSEKFGSTVNELQAITEYIYKY